MRGSSLMILPSREISSSVGSTASRRFEKPRCPTGSIGDVFNSAGTSARQAQAVACCSRVLNHPSSRNHGVLRTWSGQSHSLA